MISEKEMLKRFNLAFSEEEYAKRFLQVFIAEQIENTKSYNIEILEFVQINDNESVELSKNYDDAKITRFQINLNLKPNSKDSSYEFLVAYKIIR